MKEKKKDRSIVIRFDIEKKKEKRELKLDCRL